MEEKLDISTIKPVLQKRWKLITKRAKNYLLDYSFISKHPEKRKSIEIDKEVANVIQYFDGNKSLNYIINELLVDKLHEEQMCVILNLIKNGVIIDINDYKEDATLDNMKVCVKCVNNNYIIPDLEFNEDGVCTICQLYDKSIKDMTWAKNVIDDEGLLSYTKGNNSRFDVMILYTGGKDSSFLLWYLAKKLGLRVLAATWNMPFMQETALNNIKSAMKRLPNVEFIQRTVRLDEMREAIKVSMNEKGVPCLCPFVAYLLFYPLAIQENIPLIIDGAEKVQTIMMENVFDSTVTSTSEANDRDQTFAELMIILRSIKSKNYNKNNEIPFLNEADKIIAHVYNNNKIPIIKHLSNTESYEKWIDIVKIIETELDWKMPTGQEALLHTSCKIEKVKDYCQYKLYKNMRTSIVPQSVKEISAAVYLGYITREQGLKELNESGYFKEPQCLNDVLELLDIKKSEIGSIGGEFDFVV